MISGVVDIATGKTIRDDVVALIYHSFIWKADTEKRTKIELNASPMMKKI